MSLLFRSPKVTEDHRRADERYYDEVRSFSLQQLGAMLQAGKGSFDAKSVSPEKALTHSAAWSCIDTLAGAGSQLPIDTVRYVGRNKTVHDPDHPLAVNPSGLVEADVWYYSLLESMLDDGNTFGLIVDRDGVGRPTQIELLCTKEVTDRRVEGGHVVVKYENNDHAKFPYGDLFHVPGKFVKAGSPFGISPLQMCLETVSAAIAARAFGSNFFTEGIHPSIAAFTEDDIDETQTERIRRQIEQMAGRRRPGVFGNGLELKTFAVNPHDSQFIDLMRFVIEECCRFFKVPPQMVYAAVSGQAVTYANVTQADLVFLKYSLEPYLNRIERAISALMARPKVIRFNRDALLRVDPVTRWKIWDLRLRNQSISVNEVRVVEDEEPYTDPEFNEPGFPALTKSAESATPDNNTEDDTGESGTSQGAQG